MAGHKRSVPYGGGAGWETDVKPIVQETPLGPIWFRGVDAGRPVLLVITGAFAEETVLGRLANVFPATDVLRAHLPGNHCPPLTELSLRAFIEAFDHAIRRQVGARPLSIVGLSTGGLVALAQRQANLRRLVAVEPFLRTRHLWPFQEMLHDGRATAEHEPFFREIFGVTRGGIEERDYTFVLDGLETPAQVLLGGTPLLPRRPTEQLPSLVDDASRAILAAHPAVRIEPVPEAGHNVPSQAPETFVRAVMATHAALYEPSGGGLRSE
jgi:pimeloyl-ACP methyl ester carboxylesterase